MNSVALITGAAGGWARRSPRLAADGWQLVVVSRDAARLEAAFGNAHLQVVADCSTPAGVAQIFAEAAAAGLTPNALAHCVGNIRLGALHRTKEQDFRDCLEANLISAFHTLAGFVGALGKAGQPGAAVLVSSAAARIGTPNHEAVAAAKAGVEGSYAALRPPTPAPASASMRWRRGSWRRRPRRASSPTTRPARRPRASIRCPASATRPSSPG
jgi:NAD(P)-dependent dehydrogenase (short-subunit alcohol dehydrogenase family)